jgi:hypothetical protein
MTRPRRGRAAPGAHHRFAQPFGFCIGLPGWPAGGVLGFGVLGVPGFGGMALGFGGVG